MSTYAGAGDAFLSKVNTNATGAASLVYSTYLGGSGLDQGNGVAVDASGNAYVAGATTSMASSLGFTPPTGAFQTDCALDSLSVCEGDAFVAKFNPTLSGSASLLYFTYLGGSLADSAASIAVDTSGNAYVTGSTVSPGFPVTAGVFQPKFGGGNADAFVTELNPAGAALVYSTFLGGSNTDNGTGIAVDVNGGAYVTGQTCSLDFPLSNPLQATPGGNCDAFVSKVVPSGGVELSPAGLIFPIQSVNSTSAPQTVTLTNGGNTALTITSIALTGDDTADFSQNNTCDGSVAALGQCTITVTFTPKVAGTLTAQITITDNSPAPNSTQVVDLTGTGGNLPTVALSATSISFRQSGRQHDEFPSVPDGDEHRHGGVEYGQRDCERGFCGPNQRLYGASPGHDSAVELRYQRYLHAHLDRSQCRFAHPHGQRTRQPPDYPAHGHRGAPICGVAFDLQPQLCRSNHWHHECAANGDGHQYRKRPPDLYQHCGQRRLWGYQHLRSAGGPRQGSAPSA